MFGIDFIQQVIAEFRYTCNKRRLKSKKTKKDLITYMLSSYTKMDKSGNCKSGKWKTPET